MLTAITAVVSFIGTNIDNIFLLMLFFAQARNKKHIVIGQYLGMAILVVFSLLGTIVLRFLPQEYIRFLGLIPIALGIKECFVRADEDDMPQAASAALQQIAAVALIAIANGADNLGVYIPLFAGYTAWQMLLTSGVFAVMTALWCFLGYKLADLPTLKNLIRKHKRILVPTVFILLGSYILFA